MKWAVVVFPGSNCDDDAVSAIRSVTGDDVEKVWHQERDMSSYDAIILPGGFSYGDYLRSGAIARFSPVMQGVAEAAAAGKPVIGICNGFQVLTEAGLLPGALLLNDHRQFRCEMTRLTVCNNTSPFTCAYEPGETILLPIAHGEGRYFTEPTQINELQQQRQIAFTYEDNPNGSVADIAGVLNQTGNVLGLMPHPERAVTAWMGSRDGMRLFQSVRNYVKEVAPVG